MDLNLIEHILITEADEVRSERAIQGCPPPFNLIGADLIWLLQTFFTPYTSLRNWNSKARQFICQTNGGWPNIDAKLKAWPFADSISDVHDYDRIIFFNWQENQLYSLKAFFKNINILEDEVINILKLRRRHCNLHAQSAQYHSTKLHSKIYL